MSTKISVAEAYVEAYNDFIEYDDHGSLRRLRDATFETVNFLNALFEFPEYELRLIRQPDADDDY